jgi:hypothetical protein
MSEPDTQTFTLSAPDGSVIARGNLDALMEQLPDTNARNAALDQMLKTAAEAVEAEQRRDEALASTAQMISDAVTRLTHRMDTYIERREKQQRRDEEEALRAEQEEIQRTLASLTDPDAADPLGAANDDGDLEIKHAPSEERYGPQVEEDADPKVKPVLSYGKVPMSYIKKKDATGDLPEGVESRSPAPLGSDPIYGPANLAHPWTEDLPQVSQPTAISLNEE